VTLCCFIAACETTSIVSGVACSLSGNFANPRGLAGGAITLTCSGDCTGAPMPVAGPAAVCAPAPVVNAAQATHAPLASAMRRAARRRQFAHGEGALCREKVIAVVVSALPVEAEGSTIPHLQLQITRNKPTTKRARPFRLATL
jgi:hypothetical protein